MLSKSTEYLLVLSKLNGSFILLAIIVISPFLGIYHYILRRLILGFVSLVIVVSVVCSIIFLVPVDPARMSFGQRLENKALEQKRERLGLDLPLGKQLIRYYRDLSPINYLDNDTDILMDYRYATIYNGSEKILLVKRPYFRESYQTGRNVWEMLMEAFPLTLWLAFCSILLACVLGLIGGLMAAYYFKRWPDDLIVGLSVIGYSVPSYVSALFFSLVFGYLFANYTGLNLQGSLYELNDWGDEVLVLKNLILPCLALGIRPVAVITQITRSAMIDVLGQNYIKTARAKGVSEWVVYLKHAFVNAANPITTTVTGWFAALLSGAFFVESVFNYQGLGHLTVNALLNFDVPVVLGALIMTSAIFVVLNILTDLMYAYLDPQFSLGGE